jgi:uncharacterized membrane protein YphA (DoxX/SURF4 family)
MELPVAAIVLALLIIFFIYGSGRISVDELRRKGKKAETAVNP